MATANRTHETRASEDASTKISDPNITDFIQACQIFTKRTNLSEIKPDDLRQAVYQLVWLLVDAQISTDDVLTLFRTVADDISLISLVADVIAVADLETICVGDKSNRKQFLLFLASITDVVPEDVLKERLEPETLEAAGFIQSQKIFNQKLVRTKTKLFYKQQKYNLCREESEGYAKLITELSQDGLTVQPLSNVLENILSLLGFFNLDPNRVLDIILEAFECNISEDLFFIPLLTSYLSHCDVSGFTHMVGFKFQFYHDLIDIVTPTTLYKFTACLLRNNLLKMDQLYHHLKPSDSEIHELDSTKLDEAKKEAKKLTAVVLSDKIDEDTESPNDKEDEERKVDNQKFGLCLALLECGAWSQALTIIEKLPHHLLFGEAKVSRALCDLVHCTLEPLYRSKFSPKAAAGKIYKTNRGFPAPCLEYKQLCDNVFPMLLKIGGYIAIDPLLVVKVIRVCKGFLKEYNDMDELAKEPLKNVYCDILSLLDEVILPALSLLECNCCISEDLWGVFKRVPYEIRYRLYAVWKNHWYAVNPRLMIAKAKTMKRAKYITKRLSKENVKQSGRQIGKLSHSNPGVLFDHLLDQIQRYDNFIGPMVDSLKYLTPIAYDVLAFCVIEALSNPAKQRMKQSDTNLSAWLQSLSQFCGAVFKKYPTEITGLLQYIANQLKAGTSLDLLVLKEVVQKMSGVEANDEITTQQLEALSGGELMKSEGAYFGQIKNTRKPSIRLRDALMEGKMTIPLCLLIAQHRNAIEYVEKQDRHLKLIGKLYDQCQDNLIQFGGFLTMNLSTHDYQASLPSLDELHQTYGITPDVSFFLTRPVYRFQIQENVQSLQDELTGRKDLSTSKLKHYELEKNFCEICDNIFRPVVESAIPLQAPKIWNNLSPLLYVTFWSLSMYDLYAPVERYEEEINKLNETILSVETNRDLTSTSKKKKEKDRCQLYIEKLNAEKQTQLDHNSMIKSWLESRRDAWFPSKLAKGETITQFLQLCVFPRCVFSAIDSLYCAKFIQTIHTLESPNFSTLICFDRTFSDVSYVVASLTENEASRYGRFLCSMLQMVMRWHGEKKLYEKECAKSPGFLTILRATNSEKASYLDYENFRHVCHKWQYKLTKALILGIESKDYSQIRNTLLVLIKILPYYPQVQNLGQALERRIEKIIEDEKDNRHDLQALAVGYNGMLKARKSSMVPENKFHLKEKEKTSESSKSAKQPTAKSTVKQDATDGKAEKSVKKEKEELSISLQENRSSLTHSIHSSSEKEKLVGDDDDGSEREREKESRRSKETESSKVKDKEKRSRTDSPSMEDLKKRKISDESKKDKSDKKSDRKRISAETESKEAKRRRDEEKERTKKDKKKDKNSSGSSNKRT